MATIGHRTAAGGALVLALLLTACGGGAAPGGTEPASQPAAPGTSAPPTAPPPTGQEPAPSFLSGPAPATTELDDAVGAAREAYLRHRSLYDEGFRTGFTDPELVEDLLATTSGDLREVVRQGAEQFTGPPVDGSSEAVSLEATWVHLPVAAVDRPEVTFETCLLITGGPRPEDRGQIALTVRMVQEEGEWVVWSQQDHGARCR